MLYFWIPTYLLNLDSDDFVFALGMQAESLFNKFSSLYKCEKKALRQAARRHRRFLNTLKMQTCRNAQALDKLRMTWKEVI